MSNKQDVVFHSSNLGSGCGQGLRTLGQRSLTDSQKAEIVKLVLKVTQRRRHIAMKILEEMEQKLRVSQCQVCGQRL